MSTPTFALFLGRRQIAENIKTCIERSGYIPTIIIYDDHEITADDTQHIIGTDYIFCIHYHKILSSDILKLPKKGCVNIHPAYLPYNRGWHTPSWTILDRTPAGATMHCMTERIDDGDIICQERVDVSPEDTADSLYQKILAAEEEVFMWGFVGLMNGTATRTPQSGIGSSHRKGDLAAVQCIPADDPVLLHLRALTTNQIHEAAYFDDGGKRYAVRVKIDVMEDENV